jgi:hypothetical protein
VGRLFLHHTATPEWTGVDAARRVHQIALDRGFVEVSYSWLIDVAGNQIEGRGWGYQAHTVEFNSTAHGISHRTVIESKTALNGRQRTSTAAAKTTAARLSPKVHWTDRPAQAAFLLTDGDVLSWSLRVHSSLCAGAYAEMCPDLRRCML